MVGECFPPGVEPHFNFLLIVSTHTPISTPSGIPLGHADTPQRPAVHSPSPQPPSRAMFTRGKGEAENTTTNRKYFKTRGSIYKV
jgi:hypothetical protein